MPSLKAGDKAPLFSLPSQDGSVVTLKDLKGKKVVLYFYPKDDTPGCTVEACGFRDLNRQIRDQNAIVIGVSPDSPQSHGAFVTKFKLPFILVSDADKKTCQDYGVWVEKSMYGRKYFGVARTTFIIAEDGKIEKIYEKVKPPEHHTEVLQYLKGE